MRSEDHLIIHGRDHRIGGADALDGPWVTFGTTGVDNGVDAALAAANPFPYATGESPGLPPFTSPWTNIDGGGAGAVRLPVAWWMV